MLEVLINNKKTKYNINLSSYKNYSCWVLKEIKKDQNHPQKLCDNKKELSYGALSLYLQKINIKKKTNSKYYEMKLNNISEDIFPFDRNPDINFIYYNSNKENLFESNIYEKKIPISENFEEYNKKIFNIDIPEMILYKYKYDEKIFQEILDDCEDEVEYIYKIIQNKNKLITLPKKDIINCIESIINIHKKQLFDIPFIIQKKASIYNHIFTDDEVVNILSLYDAAYIQFKLKQKKIIKLFNQTLIITNNKYNFNYDYINNVENELDLELALSYIGFLITIFNNNSKKKICNSLMDLNKKLLQSILEDDCHNITKKFCLSPEEVVYNIKVLKKEITSKLKEPNNECQLMDLCLNKVNELSQKNKKYHPIHLLQKAINYHIISLSSHPYIAKLIYETYIQVVTISTSPTEKGNIILNSSHPSYRCKRIEKCPVEQLTRAMRNNNNNFSEIYLDIEKCENEGLINIKFDIELTSKKIQDLISLLNKAINGFNEEKTEFSNNKGVNGMNESDDNESYKTRLEYKKNVLARKLVVKNMILEKEFTQNFFINHLKKKLHNLAEKLLIEKICKKFYSIITRKYIKNNNGKSGDNNYCYSIFFINSYEFCCVAIDKNKKIKYSKIFKNFFNENKNNIEENKKLIEVNELKREFLRNRPKYIIVGINNTGCYKLIEYLKQYHNEIVIYSDYLSLLKKPKNYKNISDSDESYYYKVALDQYKFTINPLFFFIENYNFKYENNFILNIKLDPLQDQIHETTLLNYCLETKIRQAISFYKFRFPKEKSSPENYFCFINGLGPVTGKKIEENKNIKTIDDIKEFMKRNIYKNLEVFLADKNTMEIDDENNAHLNNYTYNLKEEDIFNKMISEFYPLKLNSFYNVMVNNIDSEKGIINCILFFNENIINCALPFELTPDFILNKESYFKKYRIILCKIVEIKINENKYLIKISNKIQDLEYYNKLSFIEEESYLKKDITRFKISEEDDYKLKEIEKMKKIINIHNGRANKILKKIKEDRYTQNICLDEIKKENLSIDDYGRFSIRPSFLGSDHLFLTFSIIDDLTLNYDIIIDKNKEYIIKDKKYLKISDIITNFANKLLKNINEFKNNKYFKTPSQMRQIFDSIFVNIKNKTNYYEKIIFKDNVFLCFMEDSPNYGLLLSKTINYNYFIDYIEILTNGFHFHNLFFENISLIIEYYNENHEKDYYKEFISNHHIYNIHSLIEYIDMYYDKFEQKEKIENIECNHNEQEIRDYNQFLGKKSKNKDFIDWTDEKNNFQQNNKNQNDLDWENSFPVWEENNNNNDFFNKKIKCSNSFGNNFSNEDDFWNFKNKNEDKKNSKTNGWKYNNTDYLNNKNYNNYNDWNLNNNNNSLNTNINNSIDKWNKNNSNSWDNNEKEFSNILYNNNIQNIDNSTDNWGEINDDEKKEKYENKKEKEKDLNDNNTNVIINEKISNNIPQDKIEDNAWNTSNNNYNKYKANDNSQDKYNYIKNNYKNKNKGLRDKNKKRKYNENYNKVESNFSGWGTDQIQIESQNKEEKKEECYNYKNSYENENNIFNDKNIWNVNSKNNWSDVKYDERENDGWADYQNNIDNYNNSNDNNKNNIDNWSNITINNDDNNKNNWNTESNDKNINDWNQGNNKNKNVNVTNWTNNNCINDDKINIGADETIEIVNENDDWNNNIKYQSTISRNDDINNKERVKGKNHINDNKYNKSNNEENEQIFNCSNNEYYRKSLNINNQNNNNYNTHNNRGNNSNYSKKKKCNQWRDQLFINERIEDLKDDDGNKIEFEKVVEFGGYKLEKKNDNKK